LPGRRVCASRAGVRGACTATISGPPRSDTHPPAGVSIPRLHILLLGLETPVGLAAQTPQRYDLTGPSASVFNLVGAVRSRQAAEGPCRSRSPGEVPTPGNLLSQSTRARCGCVIPLTGSAARRWRVHEGGSFADHHEGGRRVHLTGPGRSRDMGRPPDRGSRRPLARPASGRRADLGFKREREDPDSGDCRAGHHHRRRSDLSVSTGSSDVRLSGGKGTARLSTGSGDIESDFPVSVTRSGHHLVGTMGDGKGRLSVEAGSGGVRLRRAKRT
jgi:hypothetical protein